VKGRVTDMGSDAESLLGRIAAATIMRTTSESGKTASGHCCHLVKSESVDASISTGRRIRCVGPAASATSSEAAVTMLRLSDGISAAALGTSSSWSTAPTTMPESIR